MSAAEPPAKKHKGPSGSIKAVMYHYVRLPSAEAPRLKFLHFEHFCRQLDTFAASSQLITRAQFDAALSGTEPVPTNGIVLTFDDGLSDHYQFVFPELKRRGLWGIFYVNTGPLTGGGLLAVHMIHRVLAKYPPEMVAEALKELVKPAMLSSQLKQTFENSTYTAHHSSAEAEKHVKRVMNYFLMPQHRQPVARALFDQFFPGEHASASQAHYMTPAQLQEMADAGMVIGGHSATHRVLASLTPAEQHTEIVESMSTLRDLLGHTLLQPRVSSTFCYPYGGADTYNEHTKAALAEAGVTYCFAVRPEPITAAAIEQDPLSLPRYDCNQFCSGTAWQPLKLRSIVCFTSNQPRHIHLVHQLAAVAEQVTVVIEATRVAPAPREDPIMKRYFKHVKDAEATVFGGTKLLPANARALVLSMGDATAVVGEQQVLGDELQRAELVVVFGASWLKQPLADTLVAAGAINLHAGVSPYFRGCATNFWSVADGHPALTGVTVHALTAGLDSGAIITHVVPRALAWDPFVLGMESIRGAHLGLCNLIMSGQLFKLKSEKQDPSKQIRYARGKDFDAAVAEEYLGRVPSSSAIKQALDERRDEDFVNPYVM